VTLDERGQAIVETLLVCLILMIPLMWALGVLADLHRAALGVTDAAREASMDAASSIDIAAASAAVDRAVLQAFGDEGLDPRHAVVSWHATAGFPRGGAVDVRVTYPVTVAQFPFLGRVAGPSISVKASSFARIDPYRSRP
jgi:hypothetical protein